MVDLHTVEGGISQGNNGGGKRGKGSGAAADAGGRGGQHRVLAGDPSTFVGRRVRVLVGSCQNECGIITKVDSTGWLHVKLARRVGGRGTTFVETCRRKEEVESVTKAEMDREGGGGRAVMKKSYDSDIFYTNIRGSNAGGENGNSSSNNNSSNNNGMSDSEDPNANSLKTLADLPPASWPGVLVRCSSDSPLGKTHGKVLRVFKWGNGWVHASLNMDSDIKELTVEEDSSICTRAGDLELVDQDIAADVENGGGAKKRGRKGKGKGGREDFNLGVKKPKEGEDEEDEELGEISLYANRFIKIGGQHQVSDRDIPEVPDSVWRRDLEEGEEEKGDNYRVWELEKEKREEKRARGEDANYADAPFEPVGNGVKIPEEDLDPTTLLERRKHIVWDPFGVAARGAGEDEEAKEAKEREELDTFLKEFDVRDYETAMEGVMMGRVRNAKDIFAFARSWVINGLVGSKFVREVEMVNGSVNDNVNVNVKGAQVKKNYETLLRPDDKFHSSHLRDIRRRKKIKKMTNLGQSLSGMYRKFSYEELAEKCKFELFEEGGRREKGERGSE